MKSIILTYTGISTLLLFTSLSSYIKVSKSTKFFKYISQSVL